MLRHVLLGETDAERDRGVAAVDREAELVARVQGRGVREEVGRPVLQPLVEGQNHQRTVPRPVAVEQAPEPDPLAHRNGQGPERRARNEVLTLSFHFVILRLLSIRLYASRPGLVNDLVGDGESAMNAISDPLSDRTPAEGESPGSTPGWRSSGPAERSDGCSRRRRPSRSTAATATPCARSASSRSRGGRPQGRWRGRRVCSTPRWPTSASCAARARSSSRARAAPCTPGSASRSRCRRRSTCPSPRRPRGTCSRTRGGPPALGPVPARLARAVRQQPREPRGRRLVLASAPRAQHLVITCNGEGALATAYRSVPGVRTVVLDEKTNDRSLVMTSSFTNLVAGRPGPGRDRPARGLDRPGGAAGGGCATRCSSTRADALAASRAATADRSCTSAAAAAWAPPTRPRLKMLEMTDGQVWTLPESYLGLRHGPMSALHGDTLRGGLPLLRPPVRAYELDLLRELDRKRLGAASRGRGRRRADRGSRPGRTI